MVDRCVCHDVTFAELRALSRRVDGGLGELSRRTGCGTGCGCCLPYIRLMLRTGQTDFPVLGPREFRELEVDDAHDHGSGVCSARPLGSDSPALDSATPRPAPGAA